jgi:thiamine-phosphate pyrophosphorylase
MARLAGLRRGLYAITEDEIDSGKLLAAVESALRGGALMLQYRNKTADRTTRRAQAAALAVLCRTWNVPLIVNDDLALALDVDAAGVHLGSDDGDVGAARQTLGPDRVLGVSCYNRIELAEHAVAAGASYVAFGGFFPSLTKPGAVQATPGLITEARQRFPETPVAAIGGITVGNAPALLAAGADWLCVISALFQAQDIAQAARSFAGLFASPNITEHKHS